MRLRVETLSEQGSGLAGEGLEQEGERVAVGVESSPPHIRVGEHRRLGRVAFPDGRVPQEELRRVGAFVEQVARVVVASITESTAAHSPKTDERVISGPRPAGERIVAVRLPFQL